MPGPGSSADFRAGDDRVLAAVAGVVDAEHEREEAPADLGEAGPNRLCLAGRVQACGVTDRHPPDGDPGQRGHDAANVDRPAERYTAGPAHVRAVEDHGAGGDEYLVGDPAAGQM